MGQKPFRDRTEAGRVLAARLHAYRGRDDVVVLALPRGGLPVAREISVAIDAPLDVFVVRKLGVPGHEELAMGAVASGGTQVLNREIVDDLRIEQDAIDRVIELEVKELERREATYRGHRKLTDLEGKTVMIVDDGMATGSTMRAAAEAVKSHAPAKVVVAVPHAAASTCREIGAEVDEMVCAMTPEPYYAVGAWYEDFPQLGDDDVGRILQEAEEAVRTS